MNQYEDCVKICEENREYGISYVFYRDRDDIGFAIII